MEEIILRQFETPQDYQLTWDAMRTFTQQRTEITADEIWLLQHQPVFTFGQAGKPEHLLQDTSIPVLKTDRGGQITYHGPGQLIAYALIDIKRRDISVRKLVNTLEQSVIQLLADYDTNAYTKKTAPGVYVSLKNKEHKIAALGLRIKQGRSYHGLSFNIDMDLTPFSYINPCGYANMQVTQLANIISSKPDWSFIENKLAALIQNLLKQ